VCLQTAARLTAQTQDRPTRGFPEIGQVHGKLTPACAAVGDMESKNKSKDSQNEALEQRRVETVFLSHDDRLSDCGSEEEEVCGEGGRLGEGGAISTGLPAGERECVCVCVCV
jgi:hypothetical protein